MAEINLLIECYIYTKKRKSCQVFLDSCLKNSIVYGDCKGLGFSKKFQGLVRSTHSPRAFFFRKNAHDRRTGFLIPSTAKPYVRDRVCWRTAQKQREIPCSRVIVPAPAAHEGASACNSIIFPYSSCAP